MILELEAVGVDEAGRGFDLLGDRLVDMRPAWPAIVDDLLELNRRRFETGGRVGGGRPWRRLSPATLARKARDDQDPRALHARLLLRRALTQRRAAHQRLHLRPDEMTLGTSLPYAQFVTKRRPILKVPADVRDSIATKMLRYAVSGTA